MVMVYYCCCTVDVMIHSSGSSGLLTFSYSSLLNGKGKYLAVSFLSSFSYSIVVVLYYSILPTESPITLVLHSQTLATRVWLHKTSYCTIQTAICHHISQHTVSAISAETFSVSLLYVQVLKLLALLSKSIEFSNYKAGEQNFSSRIKYSYLDIQPSCHLVCTYL